VNLKDWIIFSKAGILKSTFRGHCTLYGAFRLYIN
jgi:hypothetical protein